MVESKNSISRQEASKLVRSRQDYHLAMRKAGYRMPKLSSRICTMKFMEKGRKGFFFIPKKEQCANVPECYSWPSKEFLISKLQKSTSAFNTETSDQAQLEAFKRTVALMKKREPDTEWLLVLVGMLYPGDEIFTKSYKWKKPKPVVESDDEDYLSNEDGFYDNLPQLDDKTIKKTNRMAISKRARIKKQLKAVKARQERDRERANELALAYEQNETDSDDELELSGFDENEQVPVESQQQQFHDAIERQVPEHGSDSDFNLAESPSPKKKQRTKSGKTSRRRQQSEDEEEKEGQVYKSSVMTRSALKQRRVDEEAVTS